MIVAIPDEKLGALVRDIELTLRWRSIREFTHALYGPKAAAVEFVDTECSDECCSRWVAMHETVRDVTGRRLRFDFTTPWWCSTIGDDETPDSDAEAEETYAYELREKRHSLCDLEGEGVISLIKEPPRLFRKLHAEVDK